VEVEVAVDGEVESLVGEVDELGVLRMLLLLDVLVLVLLEVLVLVLLEVLVLVLLDVSVLSSIVVSNVRVVKPVPVTVDDISSPRSGTSTSSTT
jgi:uncharacterized membrane protein